MYMADEFPMIVEREAGMREEIPAVMVGFGFHPIKDGKASIEAGRDVYKDVEFVRIAVPGDRNSLFFQPELLACNPAILRLQVLPLHQQGLLLWRKLADRPEAGRTGRIFHILDRPERRDLPAHCKPGLFLRRFDVGFGLRAGDFCRIWRFWRVLTHDVFRS